MKTKPPALSVPRDIRALLDVPAYEARSVLLTRREVGQIFRVSGPTLRRWQDSGHLPARVIGRGSIRYPLDAVQRLANGGSGDAAFPA
jgi:hypothetical protein